MAPPDEVWIHVALIALLLLGPDGRELLFVHQTGEADEFRHRPGRTESAEGLHGQSQVRLDANYWFDEEKHACVIDSGSDVGRDICRMFTSFAIREFGEESFKVRKVPQSEPEARGTCSH